MSLFPQPDEDRWLCPNCKEPADTCKCGYEEPDELWEEDD